MLLKIKQICLKISEFLKNLFELTAYLIPVLVFMVILILAVWWLYV